MASTAGGDLPRDWVVTHVMDGLARRQHILFVAGLPGVGKSLLLQHTARMARAADRRVFLLQWDVVRRAFETDAILARYPEVDGFTHAGIKRAAGLWARQAVLAWFDHFDSNDLLLGETPLVGGRLMELARPEADAVEPLLSSGTVRFVLPVPSREVRALIETTRERTIASPAHERERDDAPPSVLRALWEDVYREGRSAGLVADTPATGRVPYDPGAYKAVYASWLRHRQTSILNIDRRVQQTGSVYDMDAVAGELVPTPEQVAQVMRLIDAAEGPSS